MLKHKIFQQLAEKKKAFEQGYAKKPAKRIESLEVSKFAKNAAVEQGQVAAAAELDDKDSIDEKTYLKPRCFASTQKKH